MRVLHLEDESMLRNILKAVLEAFDHNIELVQFASSDEVVAYLERDPLGIDLFMLDMRVPGALDGLQLASKIRALNHSATIIITSAYKPPDRELLASMNAEWLMKPWHIMELTPRLAEIAKQQARL